MKKRASFRRWKARMRRGRVIPLSVIDQWPERRWRRCRTLFLAMAFDSESLLPKHLSESDLKTAKYYRW